MISYLSKLFGSKLPSSSDVDAEIAKVEGELTGLPARIAAAEAKLADVANLSDEEHASAEAEVASARRFRKRLEAQRAQLVEAREVAERGEKEVALARRRAEAVKRVKSYGALIAGYEKAAEPLIKIVSEMQDIEKEADALNREIMEAEQTGLKVPEQVVTPHEIHFSEPDEYEPDRVVTEERIIRLDLPEDRLERAEGEEAYQARPAAHLPSERVETFERVEPGMIRRRGRHMPSPAFELTIPAIRLGGERIWPPSK